MNTDATAEIAKPDTNRRCMKVNAFDFARGSNSALQPLFPYLGDGAIVPCIAVFRGGATSNSVFQHSNTVDEVAMVFGAERTFLRPGDINVGDKTHTVGSFLSDDPEGYALMVITQRQSEAGVKQHEAIVMHCEKCQHELVRHEFDSKADYHASVGILKDYLAPLHTILGSAEAANLLNENASARECPECGHNNPPFHIGTYHWDVHVTQNWCVNQSLKNYPA